MEKELTELFETMKRAADASENSPGEEERCLVALKQLKEFPVNYKVLVDTQVGKRLRQLTKHSSDKIRPVASEVVGIWKAIIVKETSKAKKHGTVSDPNTAKYEPNIPETNEAKKTTQRTDSIKSDQTPASKKQKVEKTTTTTHSVVPPKKSIKTDTSTNIKTDKSQTIQDPPKLTSKDPQRDRIRDIFTEALSKVSAEVSDDSDLKKRISECDPHRVAETVETAMFEKWGRSAGSQKFKYRSVVFNLKDPNNPDFRRKILIGDIEPSAILDLTPEEMASDERQEENEKIKQKAMFNSERAAAPKASTNEFTCGRCKKKETTYYQMQTRSADEPMTTFVTCVNCNNHWKFC